MTERRTVTVRDQAGNLSQVDVPDESEVYPFKFWTEHLESGRYEIVDEDDTEPARQFAVDSNGTTTIVDPDAVPEGNIGDITSWVRGADEDEDPADGWDERAARALEAEQAKGDDARSTLVTLLTSLTDQPDED